MMTIDGCRMFGDRSSSLPAAGFAVVALFASTTYFGQRAFESLRQPELEATKQFQWQEPPIEARLWEDPLAALRRHRANLKQICPESGQVGEGRKTLEDVRCKDAQPLSARQFRGLFRGKNELSTLIIALLPGAAFAREEEARRRARYALLAGMNAAGFEPDESERMGWLRVRRCESFGVCGDDNALLLKKYLVRTVASLRTSRKLHAAVEQLNLHPIVNQLNLNAVAGEQKLRRAFDKLIPEAADRASMEILYETLSAKSRSGPKRRIGVLWVDDTNLSGRWLTQSAMLLRDLSSKEDLQLRIIGPTSSNDLARALEDLTQLAEEADNSRKEEKGNFERNWRSLKRLQLVSHFSTAPATELLGRLPDGSPAKTAESMAVGFGLLLEKIRKAIEEPPKKPESNANPGFFIPTVGTDDRLIKALVEELCERGLDARARGVNRNVALIREWDSIYARSFETALIRALKDPSACRGHKVDDVRLIPYQFMRGLDGLTVESLSKQTPKPNDKPRDQSASIEWAEGRQQRDYLRRLVTQTLGNDRGDVDLQAIGIIGSDVHDKLILAQALRDAFPDRVIFTTDIDARLVHPSVLPYTRNLIVASSLPLAFRYDLQCGVAPFRDVYQASMFLAARYASVDETILDDSGRLCEGEKAKLDSPLNTVKARISSEIAQVRLFEIGREGAKELAGRLDRDADAEWQRERIDGLEPDSVREWKTEIAARSFYALLAGIVLISVAWLIIFVRPGPAMRVTRRLIFAQPPERYPASAMPSAWSTITISGVQIGAIGFAAGVIIELGFPGSVGLKGAIVVAIASGALFWALLMFGVGRSGNTATGQTVEERASLFWVVACVLVILFCGLPPQGHDEQSYEPFALFSGLSAWPSEMLRTFAIVLFVWFFDYAWCKTFLQAELIGEEYFPSTDGAVEKTSEGIRGWFSRRLRYVSIFMFEWQPKPSNDEPINGAAFWHEYRMRLRGRQRLARIVIGSFLLFIFLLLMERIVGGMRAEIPARGVGDRTLFGWTLLISGIATMILMVVVTDTTMLTWRFITLLKGGRTFYPSATVQRFAAELGTRIFDRAAQSLPTQRNNPNGRPGANSLLDDWIDAQLFARQTAAVGPLIIFPFILLAVLIVARSRLFDNWQIGGFVLVAFVFLVLWSVGMAALLNHGAERARRVAIERMEKDLLWLRGTEEKDSELPAQFSRLIDQIRNLRQGAFAPFFEQPLVQALLVPLGGAGGIQLLELILLARPT